MFENNLFPLNPQMRNIQLKNKRTTHFARPVIHLSYCCFLEGLWLPRCCQQNMLEYLCLFSNTTLFNWNYDSSIRCPKFLNSWKVLWILSQLLGNILPRLKVQITRITTYTQKNQTKIKRKTRARSSCDAVFSLPAPQSCLHTRSFSWIDSYMNWFQNQFLFQN